MVNRLLSSLALVLVVVHASRIFDVTEFGAIGDGVTNDAAAIQRAIDSAGANGGGRVLLPSNRLFLSGPVWLANNTDFHIASNTTLLGSPVFTDYAMMWQLSGYSRVALVNGAKCVANSSSVCTSYATLSNVTISGDDWSSTIDGNGQSWWYATNFWPNPQTLGRGNMLELQLITGLTVHSLSLRRPPSWTVHPYMCSSVHIYNLNIDTGIWYSSWPYEGYNTDGIEPDNSMDVLIEDCVVAAGDDCIAIDTTFTGNAYLAPILTHNVVVRNVTCRTPISIGARTTLGIYNVSIYNCTVDASASSLDPYGMWRPRWYATATRIKTHDGQGRGGVHNVSISDLIVRGVDTVVQYQPYYDCFNSSTYSNYMYCRSLEDNYNASVTPYFRDISYARITGDAWSIAWLVCPPLAPCTGISFTDVVISPPPEGGGFGYGYVCENVGGLDGGGNDPPLGSCLTSY